MPTELPLREATELLTIMTVENCTA